MALRLYNTLTRKKEDFTPIDPAKVRMYVCGPTVYDRIHVGNARPLVVFDVLFRLLRHEYGADHVSYVRNITDVDDKINARAQELGVDIRQLTEDTAARFHADAEALGCLPPTVEPRATEHIAQMIAMIETLIAKGNAYEADGHVLFNVPSMPDYGRLSGRNRDEQIAGARVDVAPYKKDPADFVLWKPSEPDLPGWDSPWGRGRPGWHIECSAMSEAHLGESFDIHGGGVDLVFPHHENEIAQSVCAHGDTDPRDFARCWVHNGYLQAEGEKMSKSLGNFYTVAELLDEFPGEAIRLLLLKTHYRQPLDFTKDGLKEAKAQLDRWYRLKQVADDYCDETGFPRDGWVELGEEEADPVIGALEDDLNTPETLAELSEIANQAFFSREQGDSPRVVATFVMDLERQAELLGLLQGSAKEWFRWQPAGAATVDEAEIDSLIDARNAARRAKDFAEADRIRDELAAQGIQLEDGPDGTTWRRAG
jgi:cysteinyl-tRNA synthetase